MSEVKYKILGINVWSKKTTGGLPTEQRSLQTLLENMGYVQGITPGSRHYPVNESSSARLSAVWACTRVISETLATMPLNTMSRDKQGNRTHATDHPNYSLLKNRPSKYTTSFMWRQAMQATALLHGNAFSIIERDEKYRPSEIIMVEDSNAVEVIYDEVSKQTFYNIAGLGKFEYKQVIHIAGPGFDGRKGKSMLHVARDVFENGLSMQHYANGLWGSGAVKKLALEIPGKLDKNQMDNIKSQWDQNHAGIDKMSEVYPLPHGVTVKEIGINPDDAQFIESRKFSIEEIARFFGVPSPKINQLDNAHYNNIEGLNIQFYQDAMLPWFRRWENELDIKLFNDLEQKQYYTKFNANSILRGDSVSRAQYYKERFYTSSITPDEIRRLEDENDLPDNVGKKTYIQSNMMPAEMAGSQFNKNKNTSNAGS